MSRSQAGTRKRRKASGTRPERAHGGQHCDGPGRTAAAPVDRAGSPSGVGQCGRARGPQASPRLPAPARAAPVTPGLRGREQGWRSPRTCPGHQAAVGLHLTARCSGRPSAPRSFPRPLSPWHARGHDSASQVLTAAPTDPDSSLKRGPHPPPISSHTHLPPRPGGRSSARCL